MAGPTGLHGKWVYKGETLVSNPEEPRPAIGDDLSFLSDVDRALDEEPALGEAGDAFASLLPRFDFGKTTGWPPCKSFLNQSQGETRSAVP